MQEKEIQQLIFWSIVLVCYLVRKHPILGWAWKIIVTCFVGLFAIMLLSGAKNSAKSWWNKN